jgi:pimeloyl-ACP methyl ester carboxylesterase
MPPFRDGNSLHAETGIIDYFDQTLNPGDPSDHRTFRQKFFVDSDWSVSKKAPVFLFLCGEEPCSGFWGEYLLETFNATGFALEHRYYGDSKPFATTTTANLNYLTTENVLSDIERFQKHMQSAGYTGPWIVMGVSYAGSLAAYYREKYPNLVIGAIASSAPVQHMSAYAGYDAYLGKVMGSACAATARNVEATTELALNDPTQAAALRTTLHAEGVNAPADVMFLLAVIESYAVQYGYGGPFCQALATSHNPIEVYGDYSQQAYYQMGANSATDLSSQSCMNPNSNSAGRTWQYQVCTDFGNALVAAPSGVYPSTFNPENEKLFCQQAFGLEYPSDYSAVNAEYYLPLLDRSKSSRILFTNGSDDPWLGLSISPLTGNNMNPNTSTFVMQGEGHGADFGFTTPPEVAKAWAFTSATVKSWLKAPSGQ